MLNDIPWEAEGDMVIQICAPTLSRYAFLAHYFTSSLSFGIHELVQESYPPTSLSFENYM